MVAMAQITFLCFHVWELKRSHRKTSIHGNPPFTKFNVAIHNRNGNSSKITQSLDHVRKQTKIIQTNFAMEFSCLPPDFFPNLFLALKKRLDCFCLGTNFFFGFRGALCIHLLGLRVFGAFGPQHGVGIRQHLPGEHGWYCRLVGCPIYFPDGLTIHPRWLSFFWGISEPSATYVKTTLSTHDGLKGWAFLESIGLNGRSFHSFHITSCFNCGEPDIFRSPPMTKSGLNLKPAFVREHTIRGTGIFTYMNGWFLW